MYLYIHRLARLALRKKSLFPPGLENFVTALAYHFCLALPAAFTRPGDHLLHPISNCTAIEACIFPVRSEEVPWRLGVEESCGHEVEGDPDDVDHRQAPHVEHRRG